MSDLRTTSNGDIAITNNNLTLVTAEDEVKQRLEQRLKTFRGEWFLNVETGLPYLTDIMQKNINVGVVEGIFKTHITATPGVLEIMEFNLTYVSNTRELDLRFTARSTTGEVTVEVTP